jgi:hypothetical protein
MGLKVHGNDRKNDAVFGCFSFLQSEASASAWKMLFSGSFEAAWMALE